MYQNVGRALSGPLRKMTVLDPQDRDKEGDKEVVKEREEASGGRRCTVTFLPSSQRIQEAQLPLRNSASATYFFVAKLISIAHSCL